MIIQINLRRFIRSSYFFRIFRCILSTALRCEFAFIFRHFCKWFGKIISTCVCMSVCVCMRISYSSKRYRASVRHSLTQQIRQSVCVLCVCVCVFFYRVVAHLAAIVIITSHIHISIFRLFPFRTAFRSFRGPCFMLGHYAILRDVRTN